MWGAIVASLLLTAAWGASLRWCPVYQLERPPRFQVISGTFNWVWYEPGFRSPSNKPPGWYMAKTHGQPRWGWDWNLSQPPVYVVSVPLWAPFLIAVGTAVAAAHFGKRARHSGLCRRCGYALAGLPPQALCPECGSAIPPVA